MNESDRSNLFAALSALARRYPHWRVGQLVANVAGWADAEIWDAEDEQLLAAARIHLGAPAPPTGNAPAADPNALAPELASAVRPEGRG